jgi:tetratricopeptide (TPR) repeat protein
MDKDIVQKLKKGRDHYDAKEYDKAEAYLTKVIEKGVRFADVMNMLGVIYHGQGRPALAENYFEQALIINPNYIEAALNLAVTYNDLGQYGKARSLYRHISNIKDSKPDKIEPFARGKLANMHANLAEAYAEVGDLNRAISQYREALELCSDFVDIRTKLGRVLRDAGRIEEACDELEKAKIAKPLYLPARFSLGITYLALGNRDLAKREWLAVLEADPNNTTAEMYLKMVNQMLAEEEAHEVGVNLEVSYPGPKPSENPDDDLNFSFEGESSNLSSLDTDPGPDPRGPTSDLRSFDKRETH